MTKRLPIIDDNVGTTEAAGELGMEFTAVNTSLTATEAFITYQPDVVIFHIIIPEKDGNDVLNDILNTGVRREIVLISGLSEGYLRLGHHLTVRRGRRIRSCR